MSKRTILQKYINLKEFLGWVVPWRQRMPLILHAFRVYSGRKGLLRLRPFLLESHY